MKLKKYMRMTENEFHPLNQNLSAANAIDIAIFLIPFLPLYLFFSRNIALIKKKTLFLNKYEYVYLIHNIIRYKRWAIINF